MAASTSTICGGGSRSSAGLNPQVAARISQPAGLHELLEGKVDVLIGSLRRHPGYRCDPLESGFLIAPLGTADCPEIETLRSCLLAVSPPSTVSRRTARSAMHNKAKRINRATAA